LADDGHVIMPTMKLMVPPPAIIEFKNVGINNATTFAGLCSHHDNAIFRSIDDEQPDVNDPRILFLLAYRAVIREYHVVLQNAMRFQSTYQKRVEVGLSPGTEPCNFGMFATEHLMNSFECYEYKKLFDEIYLSERWNDLEHYVIVIENQHPTIAVNSMFSLDDVDPIDTPRACLNVFPANDSTVVVVISSTSSDHARVTGHLHKILNAETHLLKYLLSKLIIQCCDNFVISPEYWRKLPRETTDAITEFYIETIQNNNEHHEDERLYLF
jgi:hypothetical protein